MALQLFHHLPLSPDLMILATLVGAVPPRLKAQLLTYQTPATAETVSRWKQKRGAEE